MDNITGKDILEIYELEKKYEEMVNDKTNMDIYPHWWYTTDYSIRKKIINQALSKKSRIRDLKEVQDMEHRANINMLFDEYKDFSNRSKKNNLK